MHGGLGRMVADLIKRGATEVQAADPSQPTIWEKHPELLAHVELLNGRWFYVPSSTTEGEDYSLAELLSDLNDLTNLTKAVEHMELKTEEVRREAATLRALLNAAIDLRERLNAE
jgi:hypothetical protein